VKIDKAGNIVALYRSAREAAEKEFISHNSISTRCLNQVKHPYRLTGYNYQYESTYGQQKRGRKKKEIT